MLLGSVYVSSNRENIHSFSGKLSVITMDLIRERQGGQSREAAFSQKMWECTLSARGRERASGACRRVALLEESL